MKRTKIIAAVATLCGSAAMAQSADNVTLYGIIDVAYRTQTGLTSGYVRSAGDSMVVASGVGPTSRWGIRGTEDLGGGLKAMVNLESGINVDTGAPANAVSYFDRASVVGLSGGWGSLQLGRQNTLLADAIGLVDPLGLRFASMNPNIQVSSLTGHQLGIEFGNTGSTGASNRVNNSAKYSIPIGPVVARGMISLGEVSGSNTKSNSTGWGVDYITDNVNVTASSTTLRDVNDRTLVASNVGASWRTGNLRVMGNVSKNVGQTTATTQTSNRVVVLGLNYAVTPQVDILTGYYRVTRSRTALADDGFNRLMAYAEYKFSRRTRIYAELDSTQWRGDYLVAGAKGSSLGISLGITHSF